MTRFFIVIALLLCSCFLAVGIHPWLMGKQVSHRSDAGVITASAPLPRMLQAMSDPESMTPDQAAAWDQGSTEAESNPEPELFFVSHESDQGEQASSERSGSIAKGSIAKGSRIASAVPIQKAPGSDRYPVVIQRYEGAPMIRLQADDPLQRQGQVACSTCHSVRKPNLKNTVAQLDQFHQGFSFAHGQLTCYACHNAQQPDALRLADGQPVAYREVMSMCSQCHSQQAIAYQHGAHGGMNGFWDLSRGPQFKNNCVDCHDPHVPKYPSMKVQFKPHDRFLQTNDQSSDH